MPSRPASTRLATNTATPPATTPQRQRISPPSRLRYFPASHSISPLKPRKNAVRLKPDSKRIFANWAASMGTSVSATASEAMTANEIVTSSSRNTSVASPVISRNGATAARLVRVPAVIADITSSAPSCAAMSADWPSFSRWREMFSSITMALSSNSPTPSASPPRLITFSVRPAAPIIAKVAMTASGIERPMTKLLRRLPRKASTTSIASVPPRIAAADTDLTEPRMK